jgi:pimeloyl-ACP methyl ester carboxylesterase
MATTDTKQRPSPVGLEAAEAQLIASTGLPVERRDVGTGDLRLHYLTCGEGDPLVLLHGRGNGGGVFLPIFPALVKHRQVIALDLPGWGLSAKPPFRGRTAHDALDFWMRGVTGLLDALGLDTADVLGHSMGGFVALGLALEHAQRVRRLVLVNSAGLDRALGMDERLVYWIKPERLLHRLGPRALRWGLRYEVRRESESSAAVFDYLYAVMSQLNVIPSGARAFDRWINLLGVHLSFERRIRELHMPVLLMWGDRDMTTPYSSALLAARALGPGHLVAMTGCGHAPFLERPADFGGILETWLEGERVSSRI